MQAEKRLSGVDVGIGGKEEGEVIDFERVEENLRRFEEVYQLFLTSTRASLAGIVCGEEVHLVAMVCKRSEVVTGRLSGSASVPRAKVGASGSRGSVS